MSAAPPLLDLDAATLAALAPAARLQLLETAPGGLAERDAAARLRLYGANEPAPARRRHLLAALAEHLTHTLALLLWFAAGLSFAAGIPELGAGIVAVVLVNAGFAFVQEHRAALVVAALMQSVALRARVVRDGAERTIAAAALVPGDIVVLRAGDVVPADCVLTSSDGLTLDLSLLTGESLAVDRAAEPVQASHARFEHLAPVLPSGAGVATGSGTAIVFATGTRSTVGRIAALVEGVGPERSVLEHQVAVLSRLTATLAVIAGAATLAVAAIATNLSTRTSLTFATGVIIALVPEGLLPTLSIALALGAQRMARRGAAIRRLSAVESIGAVTVICTDKTGTLTQNALSVVGFIAADGSGDPPAEAMRAALLCNDASSGAGDPIDLALAAWARSRGEDIAAARSKYPRLAESPFDARRRYMAITCEVDGAPREYMKGAPEALAALRGARTSAAAEAATAEAVARGERVIALACRRDGAAEILGIVRMHDPPHPEVPAAVAACRRARIAVVMLTGDHAGTARAVAEAVGLSSDGIRVHDGDALDAMSDGQLHAEAMRGAVFARIDPQQKLRITSVLERAGEAVVVTGDGINDAPALRAADVGVAMGRRGTDVAKQAADVVLSDDNFATIVAGIEEGRAIKTNIRRFASYVFTSNVAELAPFLAYIFLPVPLPLAVVQVLAIDLGTDLLPAMALGAERPSPHIMDRPPEPTEKPLITKALAVRTFLFLGVIEAALGLLAFFAMYVSHGWRPFESLDPYAPFDAQARAATFLGIVAGQIGCLFAQRDGPLLSRLSIRTNPLLLAGLLFELVLAIVLIYVPWLNGLFSMTAVHPAWLLTLPAGAAALFLLDAIRRTLAGITHSA
jgi:calcium-translocating P-type ATPase